MTRGRGTAGRTRIYFNPHATYVAWRRIFSGRYSHLRISIHMPHTWHDITPGTPQQPVIISIHMPHTWHDTLSSFTTSMVSLFQSTCHIRGMTVWTLRIFADKHISIHMPHTWHDAPIKAIIADRVEFQSTCHIRGMTVSHPGHHSSR